MTEPHDARFMYLVGMATPPDATPDEISEWNDFYNTVHGPEIVHAYEGFIGFRRFQLIGGSARMGTWLTGYEAESTDAFRAYLARQQNPPRLQPGPPIWSRCDIVVRAMWEPTDTTMPESKSSSSEHGSNAVTVIHVPANMSATAPDWGADSDWMSRIDYREFHRIVAPHGFGTSATVIVRRRPDPPFTTSASVFRPIVT